MILGRRIKQRREELHLTQDDLAKLLGYKSRSTINKIELGINDVTQHKIMAFANALQTTPAYLLGWDDEETTKKDDTLAVIILQATLDDELHELIRLVSGVPSEQRSAVKSILSALSSTK